MDKFEIVYRKNSVIISTNSAYSGHFCFYAHDNRSRNNLLRLKDNLRKRTLTRVDDIYRLSNHYGMIPHSISNPKKGLSKRQNVNRIGY